MSEVEFGAPQAAVADVSGLRIYGLSGRVLLSMTRSEATKFGFAYALESLLTLMMGITGAMDPGQFLLLVGSQRLRDSDVMNAALPDSPLLEVSLTVRPMMMERLFIGSSEDFQMKMARHASVDSNWRLVRDTTAFIELIPRQSNDTVALVDVFIVRLVAAQTGQMKELLALVVDFTFSLECDTVTHSFQPQGLGELGLAVGDSITITHDDDFDQGHPNMHRWVHGINKQTKSRGWFPLSNTTARFREIIYGCSIPYPRLSPYSEDGIKVVAEGHSDTDEDVEALCPHLSDFSENE